MGSDLQTGTLVFRRDAREVRRTVCLRNTKALALFSFGVAATVMIYWICKQESHQPSPAQPSAAPLAVQASVQLATAQLALQLASAQAAAPPAEAQSLLFSESALQPAEAHPAAVERIAESAEISQPAVFLAVQPAVTQ